MRTTTFVFGAATAALAACSWTEFDDLGKQTWVDSTGKPDVKSTDYGVAIQRGSLDPGAPGGTLAVIGAGPGSYSELVYSQAGAASLATTTLQLAAQGVMTLDSPPIFLASPASAEVALITTGDTSSVVVATGEHTLLVRQLFINNTSLGTSALTGSTPDAATYLRPLAFPGGDPSPGPAPIVAVGDVVMGTIYMLPTGAKQPACRLLGAGAAPLQIRALAAVPNATNSAIDDLIVWDGASGDLLRYKGSDTVDGRNVFNGCTTLMPALASSIATTTANRPGLAAPAHGSQILPLDATHVVLQGHQDVAKGNASYLQVYDVATMTPVGTPVTPEGVRTAALLTAGATTYVLAGAPTVLVDGKTSGQVLLYKLTAAGGIDSAAPVAALHDAQPDNNQLFGRSVAALPFNGKQVIAVAADNEIFVYFRANQSDGTALYDETRQGR